MRWGRESVHTQLYGSSRTGLMIPSSDVDLVVVDNTDLLERIAAVLQEIPWIREVRVGERRRREA